MLSDIWKITKKELRDYFSSSAALLFLSIFLIAVYLVFFWLEAFFARNLADVRPLFDWIPILFIFLIAALTMNSWSEERRRGTIELVLTSAVSPWSFVMGKFFAVLGLMIVALLLTFPIPLTVSFLGEMDWGPVIGGYIAAVFLAAAYSAIGLWSSAHTENQIVSLIIAVVATSILYVLGITTVTSIFSYEVSEWLRAIATSSRFESITRGVLDVRDIFYYLSLVILFSLFTRIKIESLRWANHITQQARRYWIRLSIVTMAVLLIANIALSTITQARVDLTQGNIYSLSGATNDYLKALDQPLLIRGYFSNSTHPLLAPLIPRARDLLSEYAVQGNGKIKVEFIDPLEQASFEEEAGMKFGIRPVAFHAESRYQATVINTYFNILVAYEDQYEVLNYKDLVDLKASAGGYEVDLNNPEYQITRAIRSTVAKANREVTSFADLSDSLVLTGYVSSAQVLPKSEQDKVAIIEQVSEGFRQQSNDNFDLLLIDPDGDQLTQEYLRDKLGVRPYSTTSKGSDPYWFYFTLTDGINTIPVSFTDESSEETISQDLIAAYKRLLPDLKKTVAIMRPLATPGPAGVSASPGIPKHFSILRNSLRQSVNIIDVDLRDGKVPDEVDFLMVLAPRYLHPLQLSALETFLNQGGSVLIAWSSIDVSVSHFTEVYSVRSGLEDWLAELGITIEDTLVLDKQHGKYSLPVTRQVGDMRVRETSLINYPYIIDVREEGLNQEVGITAKLGQVYVPWASPIKINADKNKRRTVTPLLMSSEQSWSSQSQNILPNFTSFPDTGFEQPIESTQSHLLAAMIEGSFNTSTSKATEGTLIVVGSSTLFTDGFIDQLSQSLRNEYRRPIQFIQNLVDWSLQDKGLLNVLRKHSQFTRTLNTLDEQNKTQWEYFIYLTGLLGILIIGFMRIVLRKKSHQQVLRIINR